MRIVKLILALTLSASVLISCNLLDIIGITAYVSTSNLTKKLKLDPSLTGYWLYDETDLLSGNLKTIIQIIRKDDFSGSITFLSNREGEKDATLPFYMADVKGSKFLVVGQGKFFYLRISNISTNQINARVLNKEISEQVPADRLQQWLEENIDNNFLINKYASPALKDNSLMDSEGNKIPIYSDVTIKSISKDAALKLQKDMLNIEEGTGLLAKTIAPEKVVTMNGEKWGYKDVNSGKLIIPAKYDKVQPFRGSYGKVKIGKEWGLVNSKGDEVIPLKYFKLGDVFNDILWAAVKDGEYSAEKYGYLKIDGSVLVEPKYKWAGDFSDGYGALLVSTGDAIYSIRFINTEGKLAFQKNNLFKDAYFHNSTGAIFNNGIAIVNKGVNEIWRSSNKWGIIDKTGYEILECSYDDIAGLKGYDKVMGILEKDKKFGLVDMNDGAVILPAAFENIEIKSDINALAIYPTRESTPFYIDIYSRKCLQINGSKCPVDYEPDYGKNLINKLKEERFQKATTDEEFSELAIAYPKDPRINEIQKFNSAKKEIQLGNDSEIIEYIKQYPNGKYISEAKTYIAGLEDERAFKKARELNSIDAYNNYKNSYPAGKFFIDATNAIQEIKDKPDNEAFAASSKINTIDSYKSYLQTFPNGIHKLEAENSIQYIIKMEQDYVINNIESIMETISNNLLSNSKQGFENAVKDSERVIAQEGKVEPARFLATTAYLIFAKWGLGDIDGAKVIYLKYKNSTIKFSNGDVSYSKYVDILFKDLKERISLPDDKNNFKKITKG